MGRNVKIMYRQRKGGILEKYGIAFATVKRIDFSRDVKRVTKKEHYHTSFELHMIEVGGQSYVADGVEYSLNAGSFLFLPPRVNHLAKSFSEGTKKISLTFDAKRFEVLSRIQAPVRGVLGAEAWECIARLSGECRRTDAFSEQLREGAVFELLVQILRILSCVKEEARASDEGEDLRFSMAKQYICDNIESAPTISEVADYCHLSAKQLTRIFCDCGEATPTVYIRGERIRRIQDYLLHGELSLREISERMHFANEYYFNAFFKRLSGMSPGEYRKMQGGK